MKEDDLRLGDLWRPVHPSLRLLEDRKEGGKKCVSP